VSEGQKNADSQRVRRGIRWSLLAIVVSPIFGVASGITGMSLRSRRFSSTYGSKKSLAASSHPLKFA